MIKTYYHNNKTPSIIYKNTKTNLVSYSMCVYLSSSSSQIARTHTQNTQEAGGVENKKQAFNDRI